MLYYRRYQNRLLSAGGEESPLTRAHTPFARRRRPRHRLMAADVEAVTDTPRLARAL